MKVIKRIFVLLTVLSILPFCSIEKKSDIYTVGIFQVNDAPTLNEVRRGFIQALEDGNYKDGENIRILAKNGNGDVSEIQRIAMEFISGKVDMIVPLSTPCLQAALHATRKIPIVFSSVANPYLAGAGISAEDHLSNVSGVSSEGPIKQALATIKEMFPEAERIGTLWTPSELNSNYYLELAREGAEELGLDIMAVPVAKSSEVLLSAQVLINKKIDVIYQISDNTINDSFEALGIVAAENAVPLFGGFLQSTELGACAALGWDFFNMGYKAGKIALEIKEGISPKNIPFQYMSNAKLYINLEVAEKQGVAFSEEMLKRADKLISQ
jgi:putative ABC transport system substrate-binding protein